MKGIVLAGGSGTRLYPLTIAVSKQLLPVYDKPMIFYPISTLMHAGIRDIMVITTPHDAHLFRRLLGDGSSFGLNISYAVQMSPDGLAQAFLIAKDFIGNDPVSLILGDNIFYGPGLPERLRAAADLTSGGRVFSMEVPDPERYGVVDFDANGRATSIEEKPENPKSNHAVTGLYFYDNHVIDVASSIRPSDRGQLEITDVNQVYLEQGGLDVVALQTGDVWHDAGTHASLLEAGRFIETLERLQHIRVANLEAIAWGYGWIDAETLDRQACEYGTSGYGKYLKSLLPDQS